jgi:hypothetical protein
MFAVLGCAAGSSGGDHGDGPGGGAGGTGAGNGDPRFSNATTQTTSSGVVVQPGCMGPCSDFPTAPILDSSGGSSPPGNAPTLFGKPDDFASPGACVTEPQLSDGNKPGALFPKNWARPRFKFAPMSGENLWEIRLSTKIEANDLVAYTTQPMWTLPREIWRTLSVHAAGTDITVTIRGLDAHAPKRPSGTRGTFSVAPVEARGKLVYWATTSSEVAPNTSKLVGFDVGDEGVIDALTVPQAGDRGILSEGGRDPRGKYSDPKGVPPGNVECIGCHVSTPDGAAVAFTDHWPWNSVLASVEAGSVGTRPSYLTPGAERLLNQPWLGMQTFSGAHFKAGDRVVVAPYSPRNASQGGVGFSDSAPYPSHSDGLAWFDLETKATFDADPTKGDVQMLLNQAIKAALGSAFGLFKLDGETRSAATPSFSHDGTRIAYTSAESTQDGRLSNSHEADLHIVPYNDRQGGTIQPVTGASETGIAEYYPAFSADDALLAFTRVEKPDGGPLYYRPDGEVFVIPSAGGNATRLVANDPPACTGQHSPGIINSWPKWSPSVAHTAPGDAEFGKKTYYWLIFSSARAFDGQHDLPATQYSPQDRRSSQLYMTAIVRDDTSGMLITYPAVYLWNQDSSTSNLTPAWDEFKIPPVPGPI